MRNVEFFGMRVELKASLGRYYRQWLKPNKPNEETSPDTLAEESDDESNHSEASTDTRGQDSDDESSHSEVSSGPAASEGRKQRMDSPRGSPPTTPSVSES